MTLEELIPFLKEGKIGMLPKFEGYFKWSYSENKVIIESDIQDLSLFENRKDFYYII